MERLADLVLFPIGLFSGKPLAVSIALLVLGSAFCLWLLIRFRYERPFLAAYDDLAGAIRKRRSTRGTQEDRLAAVNAIFDDAPENKSPLKTSRLKESWAQYRAYLHFSDGHVSSYADPAPFFECERVEGHNYPKWSSTLGGVFLTTGLFFTFVGLSAALLQVAPDGHGAALSQDRLRDAVQGILGISSVKFITSLAGILAYIGWSLAARFQSDAQERAYSRLLAEIRALSTYKSPEVLLLEQLAVQKAQHEQFQTFGTELAVAIGNRIDQALKNQFETLSKDIGTSVSGALHPVREELKAVGTKIGEAGGQIANGAGDVFGNVWKDTMQGPVAAFGEQMNGIVAALKGLPETVKALEAKLGSDIGVATNGLTSSLDDFVTNFRDQQTAMMGAVGAFNARVADIPAIVAAASSNSASAVEKAVESSLARMAEITSKAAETGAEKLAADVARIAASLSASADALKGAGEDSSKSIRDAGGALDLGVRNAVVSVHEAAAKSGEEFADKVGALSKVVEGLCDRLAQSTLLLEAQQNRLSQAGQVVSSASNSLSSAAAGVERAAAPLPAALANMQAAAELVAAASSQIRSTSEAEGQAARMLNDAVGAAKGAFDEQAERFTVLQDRVRETAASLVTGVSNLANQISECMNVYDERIADSIASLENAVLEVADAMETRPKADAKAGAPPRRPSPEMEAAQ